MNIENIDDLVEGPVKIEVVLQNPYVGTKEDQALVREHNVRFGQTYTMTWVHKGEQTRITLNEKPGVRFNAIHFKIIP